MSSVNSTGPLISGRSGTVPLGTPYALAVRWVQSRPGVDRRGRVPVAGGRTLRRWQASGRGRAGGREKGAVVGRGGQLLLVERGRGRGASPGRLFSGVSEHYRTMWC